MMMIVDQWLGIHFWILIAGFWLWSYACLRPYRLDALRETLFALRDKLFLIATDEKALSFDHSGYKELRNDLNGMIRFAQKMTFFRALLFRFSVPREHIGKSDWEAKLQGLPLHVQQKLFRIRSDASIAVANHVIYGSPLLVVSVSLKTVGRANHAAQSLLNRVRSAIARPLEAQARDQYRLAS